MSKSTTAITIPSQDAAPAEVFGALREGLHLAGYSFERAVQRLDNLLTDDRWQQCGEFDGDVNKFLACISLTDFQPTIDQRKSIVRKLKKIEASQRAIAKVVGVSVATVSRDLTPSVTNVTPAQEKPNENTPVEPPSVTNVTPTPVSGSEAATHIAEKETRAAMAAASAKVKDEQAAREDIEPPAGLYDVIVIDPPWPVAQNQRPQRPNQHSRPYEQMTLKQIAEIAIPADTDCWVWLWTTNKYLPHAFATLKAWKATYRYALVWDKRPDGMQLPNTPRLTAEFVLLAAIGSPLFTTTKQFPTVLSERPAGDSRKPEAFYDLVRSVTSGSRLDMFNRRSIDGFTGWGNESSTVGN